MFEKLEEGLSKTYTFSIHEIQWIVPNKELLVNGALFDVEKYTEENNLVTITGLFDKDEQDLKEVFIKLNQHQKESIPFKNILGKIFFYSQFTVPENDFGIYNFTLQKPTYFPIPIRKPDTEFYPILTPPPNFLAAI